MRFSDREDAGRQVAVLLRRYAPEHPLVLALPRGGVPVAFEVARDLAAPLDIWAVRKVASPRSPELAVGAVAEGGVAYLNHRLAQQVGVSDAELAQLVSLKRDEVAARALLFREGRPPPRVWRRLVIVVDDGIATSATARAAVESLQAAGVRKLVLAVPVADRAALEDLRPDVDDLVCVQPTPALYTVGSWYGDFAQVEDDEVQRMLRVARAQHREAESAAAHAF